MLHYSGSCCVGNLVFTQATVCQALNCFVFIDLVSKQKIRLVAELHGKSYDLDLSYITPQIVAMGFPAEGYEGMW